MIVGLTGSYCSGKDTVAEYIAQKYSFVHFSLSDVIREIMKEKNIDTTRKNLIVFGTNLREKYGNGILTKKVLEKMNAPANYCITSIRHSEEVDELRKRKDFVLIYVNAPEDIRFKRMQKRQRLGDPQTLEELIELEKKESQSTGPGQQLIKTAKMADITFINDLNDIHMLESKVDELLKNIKNGQNL